MKLYLNSIQMVIWFGIAVAYDLNLKKIDDTLREMQAETVKLVDIWSKEIGITLSELSMTMTRQKKIHESFKPLEDHLYTIDGVMLTADVASDVRTFMQDKVNAVRRIADYAEFLSFYRKEDELFKNETQEKYFYFDTDGFKNTEENITRSMEMVEDVFLMECHWWCTQVNLTSLSYNIFTPDELKNLFDKRDTYENEDFSCDCENLMDILRSNVSYQSLPMNYDIHFDDKVNMKVSAVKVATNIFERDMSVLEGIRWSESLDLVFKKNALNDPDLVWQYFASPDGFMRHYPAVKWSEERYDQTYDFRTRSWFTEAMTSPKDIIILLDRSGSMKGKKRELSHQIVNDILDTLNDNDFVNIYTFNNVSEPLVDCFNDTLFQANEENLRLLREYLPVYEIKRVANISAGLEKAFEILAHFRRTNLSANCNQAIMLITEGIDYDYDVSMFNNSNWAKDFPVRIFTYLLSTEKEDEKQMEFIACSNMGYYVNMTTKPDIREKILKYLNVMSRPINFECDDKQIPIWSYLYVDLADRRLSNWLWTKFEGIRQREVFLDHVKRRIDLQQLRHNSLNHMLLQETHDYEKYEEKKNYKYMTTVSLPVYGRRDNEYKLTGVAGIDVPISFFRALIPHDKFENILKPTFNRVDILETEILDDNNEPRIFGAEIVKLRERMLERHDKQATLNIKYTLDDMKRIIRATRHYYYTEIGPFTLCIVLPDEYGHVKINKANASSHLHNPPPEIIMDNDNWAVHPDCAIQQPEKIEVEIVAVHEIRWHDSRSLNISKSVAFLVEIRMGGMGYENNTMIRGTKAIFVEKDHVKTPVAVVGLEFNHQVMYKLYNNITTKHRGGKRNRKITCESSYLNCFILDNNAYILLSDEIEYTGRFIGDIRPDIMYYLVQENVFESTRMFDYQATCQVEPPKLADPGDSRYFNKKKSTKEALRTNSSSKKMPFIKSLLLNAIEVGKWLLKIWMSQLGYADSAFEDVVKQETKIFETLQVRKTVPTPCDREMWLFTLKDQFEPSPYYNVSTKFSCNWPYVVQKIPNSNLVFLAIFAKCSMTTSNSYNLTPEPTKITYYSQQAKVSLPCYIATMNNYTRKPYMKCYKRDKREDKLNTMDKNY
ncbi:hypothetical protein HUJ04_011437, partial [Dendroctonus ponderosae]